MFPFFFFFFSLCCIRSQMGRSYSSLSTALACKFWWVCCRHVKKTLLGARVTERRLCRCRACLTVSWSPTTASDTSAAGPAPTTVWRWSSWTTAPWSRTPPWSTWRAATAWIASSSTTASRSPAPASRDYGWVAWADRGRGAPIQGIGCGRACPELQRPEF